MTMNPEVNYFDSGQGDRTDHLSRIDSADFWRQLNPHLTLTSTPFRADGSNFVFEKSDLSKAAQQIRLDGYLQSRPSIPLQRCQDLSQGVHQIIAAGYHPNYITLYDEYWQTLQGIVPLLEPILGPHCYPLGDYWTWCISPQTAGAGWAPHRDYQFKTPTLHEDGRPKIVTVWLPLTEATTLNGCMYLVPMQWDPNLPDHPERYAFRDLQDIRALPAQAGSVLAWNQYVMHWGSRCSLFAEAPRISTGIYFQSAEVEPYVLKPVDFCHSLPFERRLGFIASNMLNYHQYHHYPKDLLDMCLGQVQALENYAKLIPAALLEQIP